MIIIHMIIVETIEQIWYSNKDLNCETEWADFYDADFDHNIDNEIMLWCVIIQIMIIKILSIKCSGN